VSGGYITTKADAANPPMIRNLADVAQSNVLAEPVDEVARRLDRWAREKGMANLRAQIDGDAREAAFRIAVRNLPLTAEEISDLVPRLFAALAEATPAQKGKEAITTSSTEEGSLSMTLP
jgi:hypothetical protein